MKVKELIDFFMDKFLIGIYDGDYLYTYEDNEHTDNGFVNEIEFHNEDVILKIMV